MDSNNIIEFPKMHQDTLADALGLHVDFEKEMANATLATTTTLTTTRNNITVYANVNSSANCPHCNQPMFAIPRMGISHVCKTDIVNSLPNDTQYARENLYDVIESTARAIDKMNHMIDESPTARNFEVLGQLLQRQAETSQQLLALQEKKVKLAEITGQTGPKNVSIANAVFVGTNAELLDMLKGKSHKVIEHEDMRED